MEATTQHNTHTSQRKVYQIEEDFGRGFGVEALFTAHPEDVAFLQGQTIYFGEISGKHSEISLRIQEDTIKVLDAPPEVILWIESHLSQNHRDDWTPFDTFSISGHNPLCYLGDEGDEGDEDK